jgi:hypothetical protein
MTLWIVWINSKQAFICPSMASLGIWSEVGPDFGQPRFGFMVQAISYLGGIQSIHRP